jgi:uncharacterized sulfatase
MSTRPNIVIFIADDLSFHDLGCWGNPDVRTPRLDQLAREGMRLTNFFSPAAVCSPSRQALLTGMYPVRNGAYPNHAIVRSGTKTLPTHLSAQGYRVAQIGKKHYGPAANYPFEYPANNTQQVPDEDGGLNFAAAEEFIRSCGSTQPFCLYIATNDPHAPWKRGDRSPYDPKRLTLAPYLVDTPETREELAAYYAQVALMDTQAGRVLDIIDRSGSRDNTIFLFVTDQGSSMPHAKWTLYDSGIRIPAIARWPGKIKAGSENAALVQYVDLLPTLLHASGADPTSSNTGCPDTSGATGFDGSSFLDVLLGKSERFRKYVYAEHTALGIINGPDCYPTRAVRDERWKLILNLNPEGEFSNVLTDDELLHSWRRKGEVGDAFAREQAARYVRRPAVELYDLQNDPWELNNVAEVPANRETISRLRAQLESWMKQQGDEGVATELRAREHQEPGRRPR